jgi:hypothetical protein
MARELTADANVEASLGVVREHNASGALSTNFLIDPEEEMLALFMAQVTLSAYYPCVVNFPLSCIKRS